MVEDINRKFNERKLRNEFDEYIILVTWYITVIVSVKNIFWYL